MAGLHICPAKSPVEWSNYEIKQQLTDRFRLDGWLSGNSIAALFSHVIEHIVTIPADYVTSFFAADYQGCEL